MAVNFGLVERSLNPKRGGKSCFTPEGKVALRFLKMYTATYYESKMRFPTDQTLLWECNENAYAIMRATSEHLGIPMHKQPVYKDDPA